MKSATVVILFVLFSALVSTAKLDVEAEKYFNQAVKNDKAKCPAILKQKKLCNVLKKIAKKVRTQKAKKPTCPKCPECPKKDRSWKHVGTIDDFDTLKDKYPFTKYEWGGTYNNANPMPIVVSYWNRGLRVYFKEFYLQGDDGNGLTIGNAVWTRGTDDKESKDSTKFYHRYVNKDMKTFWSNGYGGLHIYVREL